MRAGGGSIAVAGVTGNCANSPKLRNPEKDRTLVP